MGRRRALRRLLQLPRAAVLFAGITSVIVGILGMHIWMGGHGGSSPHLAAASAQAPVGAGQATDHPAWSASAANPESDDAAAHHVPADSPSANHGYGHAVASGAAVADGDGITNAAHCAGLCGADMETMAGMCLIVLLAVSLLAWLMLAGGRRRVGPPIQTRVHRTAQATIPRRRPSLTQLSICRT